MTSRLKHKLELDNVNLKSAYLNESFVLIGTPLPALADTKKDKLEYVPEWQQEVRDEQGRRRFHGAFTGGYSAGYFNSVGSKEGWAPSTFKSSRQNRTNKVQRPEDFMDEEDLQQMNEDRKLENTEQFQNDPFAGQRKPGESLPSTLESLIAPAQTSIGRTLLQKLGWRPGQGIGPRVTLRKLRIQDGKFGRRRVGMEKDDEDEEMELATEQKHTFAPRDVKLLVYRSKEDREGLGYEKGSGMGKLPGKIGSGMAVGGEDEDEDPYDTGTGGSSSRAFAFDNGEEDEDIVVMGGPSRARPNERPNPNAGRNLGGDSERWHDGRPVIPGFALDPLGVPPDKWFEMPEIPADWRPRPARVWGTTRKLEEVPSEKVESKEAIRGAPGKPLTYEERGAALGEEQRISKTKSVFEYMSGKDRERLASIAAQASSASATAPPPLSMDIEPDDLLRERPTEVVIPPLSPRTASAALRGFIPYGDDAAKQDRYRSYLSSQTYNTTQPQPDLFSGTLEQINKELDDFAASARIFRPMSYAMSNRFTSGSTALAATDLKQPKPGLHIYDAEKAKADMEKPKTAEAVIEKILTPKEQAAQNGMYGKLTREVINFYPVKLLCKRFGVADPHPEGDPGKTDGGIGNGGGQTARLDSLPLPSNDASWQDKFIHEGGAGEGGGAGQSGEPQGEGDQDHIEERRPKTLAEVGMAEDVNQGRDTLSYTKPSIDIFKAIFASDDEDDDDDEEEEGIASKEKATNGTSGGSTGGGAVAVTEVRERQAGEDPFPVPARDEGPVDLATFKPVFNLVRGDDKDKKRKKEKKDKEKKKRKGVLSFDVGEDGEDAGEGFKREEKRKRKEDQKEQAKPVVSGQNGQEQPSAGAEDQGDGNNEGEWVEKTGVNPRLVGRKGAADFM